MTISTNIKGEQMIRFTEVIERRGGHITNNASSPENYEMRDVYINPEHIVMVREDTHCSFVRGSKHTKLVINRGSSTYETTVVGSVSEIYESINTRRSLLKG
jgi:hypothetical protein